jgi:hypothetical protein
VRKSWADFCWASYVLVEGGSGMIRVPIREPCPLNRCAPRVTVRIVVEMSALSRSSALPARWSVGNFQAGLLETCQCKKSGAARPNAEPYRKHAPSNFWTTRLTVS